MKWPKGTPCHACAPAELRRTPNYTGSPKLDAAIRKNPNPVLKDRLALYGGSAGPIYQPRTAYNGYTPDDEELA